MKEMEELKTSTDVTSVESSNPESSSFIDNQSTEPETVQKEVTFPDPATEDEEIEGEIDTNMEVATQSDQGQSSFENFVLLSLEGLATLFQKKRSCNV